MTGEVIREFVRPQDRLELDFSGAVATHVVARHTPTGELRIEPIERVNQIVLDWRRRPAPPGTAVTWNIYPLSDGRAQEALDDPEMVTRLESCEPLLFAVETAEDAELLAEALRDHLARMNAAHGRH